MRSLDKATNSKQAYAAVRGPACQYRIAAGSEAATVADIEEDYIAIQTRQPVLEWDEEVLISQRPFTIAPAEIATCLDSFWKRIWQRDDGNFNFVHQTPEQLGFHALLASILVHPETKFRLLNNLPGKGH